jgi:hypothetical protein
VAAGDLISAGIQDVVIAGTPTPDNRCTVLLAFPHQT